MVLKNNSYEPIVKIHEGTKRSIIDHNNPNRGSYFHPEWMFNYLSTTVVDKDTHQLIQLEDLHKAVNNTETAVGSATLFRSLMQPPTSLELVLAKQEALKELESDDKLRNAVEEYVGEFKDREPALFRFLNDKLDPRGNIYGDFKKAMAAGLNITKTVEGIPQPQSSYLSGLIGTIKDFEGTQIHQLMKGPIYGGFMKGVRTKDNVGFFTPAWKFRPSRVSSIGLSASIPFTVLIGSSLLGAPLDVSHFNPHVVGMIGAAPLFTIMHGVFMKPMSDLIKVINPLRDLTVSDNAFNYAVDSVGSLDEILSFVKWGKDIQHENTIPVVTDEHVHYFEAQDLRNPVQARDNPDYVPNDVNLNGSRLTLITGPNSGGKTTYCKSVAQNQILGQVGSRVLASSAKLNITDRIAYQAPMFDALQDDEGRFGTELKRTRDIFYATSPKSLVILDELSEGTTAEEKMEQSRVILDGFYTIGNNTMLVTHNHDLVDAYREKGRGQYLQAEFNGHTPTHRMKDGISRVSHANKVAEKIGFAKKDIETHLKDKGYI